ncbi:hypothetical protein O3Q51_14325 [Cryomorphaceae bacterium 1068]|nr:hypothetical protein [Cryomorphaceae bacterium 1068]
MADLTTLIFDVYRFDVLIGFGIYSTFYFLLQPLLKRRSFFKAFDHSAIELIIYGGVLSFGLFFLGALIGESYDKPVEAAAGEVATNRQLTFWIQILVWFLLSQSFRIGLVRKYWLSRVLVILLSIISYEVFVIILTSLHRDYTNDSMLGLNRTIGAQWIFYGLLFKLVTFVVMNLIYYFALKRIIEQVRHRRRQ